MSDLFDVTVGWPMVSLLNEGGERCSFSVLKNVPPAYMGLIVARNRSLFCGQFMDIVHNFVINKPMGNK